MTLKGNYSSGTAYVVGDIVLYTDGVFYHMTRAAAAGTPPTETRYWNRLDQTRAEAARMAMDLVDGTDNLKKSDLANNLTTTATGKALDARQGKALKDLIDALDVRVTALEPKPEETEPSEPSGGD